MCGIFTYIYHKDQPNVDKYTIHGSFRIDHLTSLAAMLLTAIFVAWGVGISPFLCVKDSHMHE